MATIPYIGRLGQLEEERAEKVARSIDNVIPINRPQTKQDTGLLPPQGAQPPVPEQPADEEPDMDSMWGRQITAFGEKDSRFTDFMEEYQNLAKSLGQQVRDGMMPRPIAEQRLNKYLQDSGSYFKKNQPTVMDNPQFAGAIEQALSGMTQAQEQSQPTQMPEGGV